MASNAVEATHSLRIADPDAPGLAGAERSYNDFLGVVHAAVRHVSVGRQNAVELFRGFLRFLE